MRLGSDLCKSKEVRSVELLALVPFLLMFVIYLAVIGFTIWFAISLINVNKQRNVLLKEISNKLRGDEFKPKEE